PSSPRDSGKFKIAFQIPLVFHGVTQNHPHILKKALLDIWEELPHSLREKLSFHTWVYSVEDKATFEADFADGLPIVLEKKGGYASFVRFLAGCQGVINLTAGSILGRVTFLSAAQGLPGIFSDNSFFNQRLYPGSSVDVGDRTRLRELIFTLLRGLETRSADP